MYMVFSHQFLFADDDIHAVFPLQQHKTSSIYQVRYNNYNV